MFVCVSIRMSSSDDSVSAFVCMFRICECVSSNRNFHWTYK